MTLRDFPWKKQGLVFAADIPGFTHGSHACVLHLDGDEFAVAFSCRDASRKSHFFLSKAIAREGRFELTGKPKLALAPGPLGHFDADGVLSSQFLTWRGTEYLYYGGWENLVSVPYTANTGRLLFDHNAMTVTREFPSPILARNPVSPIFSGAPCFVDRGEEVWAWYTSAIRWEITDGKPKHYYSIRRGVSRDGVDWVSDAELVIPFADEHEYAVARSSIVEIDGVYYMWFAHRATKDIPTYRIGVASSADLVHWTRDDSRAGIDVSPSGWDSEMICYPQVLAHRGWLYLLYNGNGYGRTGFGCASFKL